MLRQTSQAPIATVFAAGTLMGSTANERSESGRHSERSEESHDERTEDALKTNGSNLKRHDA